MCEMSAPEMRPRVIVTKLGFDGHDRGSRIVAHYLRDSGMEVIYTAPWQTLDTLVSIALQEDVDVIGISSLATDHLIVPQLVDALRAAHLEHIRVVVGGIVPDEEAADLLRAGVSRIFGPGSSREQIVSAIASLAREARADGMAQATNGRTNDKVAS
jgi:methylmalonyl-CoA mutase C-terminal domain/subunit